MLIEIPNHGKDPILQFGFKMLFEMLVKMLFFCRISLRGFYYGPEGGKSTLQILNPASDCIGVKTAVFRIISPRGFYYGPEGGKSTPQILNPASDCIVVKPAVFRIISPCRFY